MLSSFSSFQSLLNHSRISTSAVFSNPVVNFTSGSGTVSLQNGFTLVALTNTGNYSFNMTGFNGVTVNFCIVGAGSSGCLGYRNVNPPYSGSSGSGGQIITGQYTFNTNDTISVTARVGLGGEPSYFGNGGSAGTPPRAGLDINNTFYGTTTTNDPENVLTTNTKCSGGYTNLVSASSFGTIKAMGGNSANPGVMNQQSTCPSSGQSVGSLSNSSVLIGRSGGIGITGLSTVPPNGTDGHTVSIAGTNMVFSSSGGVASTANSSGVKSFQSTAGLRAGNGSGSSLGAFTGWSNPNLLDGFPAEANSGCGGGSSSGVPGGTLNNSRQAGGAGGSGVIYIWYISPLPPVTLLLRYNFSYSGTTILDQSGNSRNAVISGSTNSIANLSSYPNTNLQKNNTVCYALVTESVGSTNHISLNSSFTMASSDYSFSFWLYPFSNTDLGDSKVWESLNETVMMWRGKNTSPFNGITYNFANLTNFTIAMNTWSHVVFTCNSNTLRLNVYVNNVLVLADVVLTSNNFYTGNNVTALRIGRSLTTNHHSYRGAIADFRMYNNVLNSDYVDAIFNGNV